MNFRLLKYGSTSWIIDHRNNILAVKIYSVRSTPRCIFQKCTVARCWLVRCGLCILAPVLFRHDSFVCIPAPVALGDRFWLFIQTLNNARKLFNSIFNSKENSKYSFKPFIHSIGKKLFKLREHIGKIEPRSTQINLIQVFIKLQSISEILLVWDSCSDVKLNFYVWPWWNVCLLIHQ